MNTSASFTPAGSTLSWLRPICRCAKPSPQLGEFSAAVVATAISPTRWRRSTANRSQRTNQFTTIWRQGNAIVYREAVPKYVIPIRNRLTLVPQGQNKKHSAQRCTPLGGRLSRLFTKEIRYVRDH